MENNNELRPVRCSFCGRFLAYESISSGGVFFKCAKCKNWTLRKVEGDLTYTEGCDTIEQRVSGQRG